MERPEQKFVPLFLLFLGVVAVEATVQLLPILYAIGWIPPYKRESEETVVKRIKKEALGLCLMFFTVFTSMGIAYSLGAFECATWEETVKLKVIKVSSQGSGEVLFLVAENTGKCWNQSVEIQALRLEESASNSAELHLEITHKKVVVGANFPRKWEWGLGSSSAIKKAVLKLEASDPLRASFASK